MKTLVASDDGRATIRKARLAWIAQVLARPLRWVRRD